MMDMDPLVEAAVHSQKIARKMGSAQMAVEVYGWAIENATYIPTDALKELMDILSREPT